MKRKVFSFILVLLGTGAQAQYFPDTAWTRCYGGSEPESVLSIQQTLDHGFIVLGTSWSSDGDLLGTVNNVKLWIFKIDSVGNIEWQTFGSNINSLSGKNIRQTSDGGYIIGGERFTKLKPDGTVDWQINIRSTLVCQTADGGYALMDNCASDMNSASIFTKLSPAGTTEWSTEIIYFFAQSIEATDDTGTLVSGYYDILDPPFQNVYCEKINKYGDHEIIHFGELGRYYSGKPTQDEKFILVGIEAEWGQQGYAAITKADSEEIWQQQLHDRTYFDILQKTDESFVACGKDTFHQAQAVVSKVNALGGNLSTIYFGGSNIDMFNKIIETADGGYLAMGWTRSDDGHPWNHHGDGDIWLVKFKPDTSVQAPLETNTFYSQKRKIEIYPNPSTGYINVSLPEGYEKAEFALFNIMGQQVPIEVESRGRNQRLYIKNQPPGQYILQIRENGEQKSFRIKYMP